jgi:hypothetical protein
VRDADDDDRWHNQPTGVWAAGLAAAALLGLLIFAVVQMSGGGSPAPQPGAPLPSYQTSRSTSSGSTTSTSTDYPVPSVQTSEESPGAPLPGDQTTDQAPDVDGPTSAPSTSTTIFNPYVTTTPPAAGHV